MMISVIIPCFGCEELLPEQLWAVARQVVEVPFEIVLVDNGENRNLASFEGALGGVRVRVVDATDKKGINHARNVGMRTAQGELFVFCDADDLVHPGWLQAYATSFALGLSVGGGLCQKARGGRPTGDFSGINSSFGYLPYPTGANCAVAREVLDRVGEFDESFAGGCDEVDFFWRAQEAGFALWEVRSAAITYVQRDSLVGVARQARAYGRGAVHLYLRYRPLMPRRRLLSFPWHLVRLAAAIVRHPSSREGRMRLVRHVAAASGRLETSFRMRTFYF